VEIREQNLFKISKRLAALENLHDSGDINMAWENVVENIIYKLGTVSHYEGKQHSPWFDAKYSKFVGEMKQAKLHWLQDLSQIHII
jgi:hypothetical protein